MLRLLTSISPLFLSLMMVFGLLSALMNMTLIGFIAKLLDGARTVQKNDMAIFTGLCFAAAISNVLSQACSNSLSQKVVLNLRLDLCNKIVATPLPDIERIGRPQLLAFLTGDIMVVANALGAIPLIVVDLFILLGAGIYLFMLSPELMLGSTLFLIVGVSIYVSITRSAAGFFKQTRIEHGNMQKHFRSLLEGIKELKMNRHWKASFMSDHVYVTHKRLQHSDFRARLIYDVGASVGSLLFFLLIGILIFFAPAAAEIAPSILLGYTLTILYCMRPLSGIMNFYPAVKHGAVAHKRLSGISSKLQPEPAGRIGKENPAPLAWNSLHLSDITYAYKTEAGAVETSIGPVNIALSPGEIVFIVGGNGAGKTTIGKILTGLYVPTSGAITFNGEPITDDVRDEYRQNFAVVFSDFHLFDTVLSKDETYSNEEAAALLDMLGLSEKITIADGAFSTLDLSTGEKKRLALLVAYLEDKPIYVLDEWAADQDPIFKKFFYNHLIAELKARNKCVVVITHDDRYFHLADRMIRIDS